MMRRVPQGTTMANPCAPYDPVRGLLTRAGMICRKMSLAYEDADPARVALLHAAREIEALEVPAVPSEIDAIRYERHKRDALADEIANAQWVRVSSGTGSRWRDMTDAERDEVMRLLRAAPSHADAPEIGKNIGKNTAPEGHISTSAETLSGAERSADSVPSSIEPSSLPAAYLVEFRETRKDGVLKRVVMASLEPREPTIFLPEDSDVESRELLRVDPLYLLSHFEGVFAEISRLSNLLTHPSATRPSFKEQDADMLAAAVDRAVRAGTLDGRSEIADCRLDYGKPFTPEEVEQHLSKRRHGKNASTDGGGA